MWTKLSAIVALVAVLGAGAIGTSFAVPRGMGGITVSQMTAAQSFLVGRLVEDPSGRPIGRVRSIDAGREGKAEVVNIEIGQVRNRGTQIVAVNAHQIVYYPQRGKLVASLDPPPVTAPRIDENSPERASIRMPGPLPTSFQN